MSNLEEQIQVMCSARYVGYRVGVDLERVTSIKQLRNFIHAKDPKASELLETYISRFFDWSDFDSKIAAEGKQGALSEAETLHYVDLMTSRDKARQACTDYFTT